MVGLCVLFACCRVSCVSTFARDYPPVILFMVYLILVSVLASPNRRSKNLLAYILVFCRFRSNFTFVVRGGGASWSLYSVRVRSSVVSSFVVDSSDGSRI